MKKGRILSGVQPTGNLHIGNYLGAIQNWVKLQEEFECLYCLVDLHAITVWQDPAALRASTREVAAALIAAGIDPKRHILFVQSQVAAHAQLAWIFNCVARIGWLNRMTQFKEKAGKNREQASVGLYDYPVLMAADILIYKATHVPVGEDQKQHLELARDIAQKFNNDFGVALFPLPEPKIEGAAKRVMSLRDGRKKMSKSDESDYSRINLTDSADQIAQKIRKAKTDPLPVPKPEDFDMAADRFSGPVAEERPEAVNLVTIYAALAEEPMPSVLNRFGGQSFSEFKSALTDLAVAKLQPISEQMRQLLAAPDHIDRILSDGTTRARAIAMPVLAEIEERVGFLRC